MTKQHKNSCSIVFDHVRMETTDRSQAEKFMRDQQVAVDKKTIYVGNFTTDWRNVQELEIRPDDRYLKFVDGKRHRIVECEAPQGEERSWASFERFVQKINNKRERKKGSAEKPQTVGRKKERRTFGSKHKPLKRIIHRNNWLQDDEDGDDYSVGADKARDGEEKKQDSASEAEMEMDIDQAMEQPDDPVEEDLLSDVDDIEATKTPKRRLQQGRRRLRKRVAESLEDPDTDDDAFEDAAADMTTPNLQHRVVSPLDNGHAVGKEDNNADTDDHHESKAKKPAPPKGNIAAFFGPRGSSKVKSVDGGRKDQDGDNMKGAAKTPVSKTPRSKEHHSSTPKITSVSSPRRSTQELDWLTAPPTHPSLSPTRRALKEQSSSPPRTGRKEFKSKYSIWSKFDDIDDEEKEGAGTTKDQNPSPFSPAKRTPSRSILKRRKLVSNSSGRFGMNRFSSNTQLFRKDDDAVARDDSDGPYKGFQNMGNTCYLNSSLQMLYTVKDFVDSLEGKGGDLVQSIVSTAQRVSDSSVSGSLSAKAVKNAIDKQTDNFRGFEQRDAHEFLGELIDKIHDELAGKPPSSDQSPSKEPVEGVVSLEDGDRLEPESSASSKVNANEQAGTKVATERVPKKVLPTDEFFRCDIEVCLTCQSCGYSRTKQEMYRHLSLDISQVEGANTQISVEKSLEQFFKPEERDIICEKCDDGTTASQTLRLLSRPKALLVHLKRFVPGIRVAFRKNKAPVELSEHLSMDNFLREHDEESASALTSHQYSLKSLVYHIGTTASSGHYTADALRTRPPLPTPSSTGESSEPKETVGSQHVATGDTISEWVSFDDSKTSVTKLSDIVSDTHCQKTAYMLLYTMN